MIAPVAAAVRAQASRSIEQLVWLLCEALTQAGHDVTLFATADSSTAARVHSVYRQGYDEDATGWDWRLRETLNAVAAFERAADFDVIHSHAYHFALPFTRLVSTPVVHTYHVNVNPDVGEAYALYPDAQLVAVSDFQRRLAGRPDLPVVHHGIDVDAFPFGRSPGDYLMYLGNLDPRKGPLQAIEAAAALDLPIVIAGACDRRYYNSAIRPHIDGRRVRYVGTVGVAERNRLLAGAGALLYPLVDPEPFGLVMIEAMACGTPVAGVGIGAVPEIVDVGCTGQLVDHAGQLAKVIPATLALDRAAVRDRARVRFAYHRMTRDYERVYRAAIAQRRPAAA